MPNWKWRRKKKRNEKEATRAREGKERGKEKVEEKSGRQFYQTYSAKNVGRQKENYKNGARRNNIEERLKTNNGGNGQGVKKPEFKA